MRTLLVCGCLLGLLTIGCEKKEEKPAVPSTPQAGQTPTPAAQAPSPAPAGTAVQPDNPAAGTTAQPPAPTMSATEAQSKLDQVIAYIKDKKYDLAEKLLSQLEGMKASLPTSIQSQIEKARSMLNTAKAAAGDLKLPSVGK